MTTTTLNMVSSSASASGAGDSSASAGGLRRSLSAFPFCSTCPRDAGDAAASFSSPPFRPRARPRLPPFVHPPPARSKTGHPTKHLSSSTSSHRLPAHRLPGAHSLARPSREQPSTVSTPSTSPAASRAASSSSAAATAPTPPLLASASSAHELEPDELGEERDVSAMLGTVELLEARRRVGGRGGEALGWEGDGGG